MFVSYFVYITNRYVLELKKHFNAKNIEVENFQNLNSQKSDL